MSEHLSKRIPADFPAFMLDDVSERIPDLMPEQCTCHGRESPFQLCSIHSGLKRFQKTCNSNTNRLQGITCLIRDCRTITCCRVSHYCHTLSQQWMALQALTLKGQECRGKVPCPPAEWAWSEWTWTKNGVILCSMCMAGSKRLVRHNSSIEFWQL